MLEASLTAVESTEDASPVSDALLTLVRSFLTTTLEEEAEIEAAVGRVLEPLTADGDLSPKAKSLLSVVEHIGQRDSHRSKLDPETAKWTTTLRSNTNPYLKHRPIAAFNSLDLVAPAAAGIAVDIVFPSINQWVQSSTDPSHLRTLAALPWGDQLEAALGLVASKADEFSSFDDVVPILRRAHDHNVEIPDDLLNRFVKHVQANPIDQIPYARTIWSSFSALQQSRMLLSGLPGSDTATELINNAPRTTFRYVVVAAATQDRMSHLLGVTDLRTRSDEILAVVSSLVDEHATVDKTSFGRLIEHVGQAEVAALLASRLVEPSGEARTALKLLSHLDASTVGGVILEVDEAAAAQLHAWDESVVDELVKVRADRPLSASLDAAVDEMLGEDEAARSKALKLKPKKGFLSR